MRAPRRFRLMWTGKVFVPQNSHLRYLHSELGEGEIIEVVREEGRDMHSHRSFFAQVNKGWENLPERLTAEYPTPDHLRKKLLIKCGWFDTQERVYDTNHDALIVSAFISDMDPYAVIEVRGNVVRIFTAKSQALSEMDRREFQRSKVAVLDEIQAMIHVTQRELERNAEGEL